jgi:hypothetical protein
MAIIFQPVQLGRPIIPERTKANCRFKATYTQTINLLDREARQLGGRDVVVELVCESNNIGARGGVLRDPKDPSVRITVTTKKRAINLTCTRFSHWHENLRGCALTLERLRLLEAYGCIRGDEQYAGFAALPNNSDGRAEAEAFIRQHSGGLSGVEGWRVAAKRLHPDTGGSAELFQKLQDSKQALGI